MVVAFEESSVAVTVEPIDASVAQAFSALPSLFSSAVSLFGLVLPLALALGLVACSVASSLVSAFADVSVEVGVVVESLVEVESGF